MAEKLQVEIGADVKSLKSGINQAEKSLKGFQADSKRTSAATDDMSQSFKKASTSMRGGQSAAISFNRVIQDAPYGIMGVSNNITQLAEQFTYLKQETGSSKVALKAAFTSLISPMNLMVLGISAVTTALTFYSMRSRGAAKDTKDFVDTLGSLDAARLKGSQSAQKELVELQSLYSITQDNTRSIGERTSAVDTLQKKYPSYLGNMSQESILAGNAVIAYKELTGAILGAAQAQAYYDRIAKNASQVIENQYKLMGNQADLTKAISDLTEVDRLIDAASGGMSIQGQRQIDALIKKRERLQDVVNKYADISTNIAKENNKLQSENSTLINQATNAYSKYYKLTDKTAVTTKEMADNSRDNLSALLSTVQVASAGLGHQGLSTSIIPAFGSVDTILPTIITEGQKVGMAFNDGFQSVFSSVLADSIGNALSDVGSALASGGNVIQSLGTSLLASFGDILTRLGKMAIQIGTGMLGIKTALKTLNPAVAIAAGAALVALGSFYSKGASQIGSSIGSSSIAGQGSSSSGGNYTTGGSSYTTSYGGQTVTFEIAGTKLIGVLRNAGAELARYGG